MVLIHLLIAAFVASAAIATDAPCACVKPDQVINSISDPMLFFQHPTLGGIQNGITCSMNCTFTATMDKSLSPGYSLVIQILTNKLGDGTIAISGMNGSLSTIDSNTIGLLKNQLSYGDSIVLSLTESASNLGEFMLVVQQVAGRAPLPFTQNPLLVANDIMLAFDLSSPDLEKYKQFAINMINELAINPKSENSKDPEDCEVGSRLSIVGLSASDGFDYLYSPYWTETTDSAIASIKFLFPIAGEHFYFRPVGDKYIYGFDRMSSGKSPDVVYTNCKNREKIFILLTSSSPTEYQDNQPDKVGLETTFVDKGVHQIIAYYNMTAADQKYYELYDNTTNNSNIWNFFEITGGNSDVANFFNSFLVNSKEPMTCQPTSTDGKVEVVITNGSIEPAVVSIPPYYNARKGDGTGNWDTVKHYCNFQETTVRIIKGASLVNPLHPDEKTKLCVKVFFDLESGKDFVIIFSGDPNQPSLQEEVARFTGRNISASFELPDALGSIVFSSDEKNVYDGFRAEITRAVNGYC